MMPGAIAHIAVPSNDTSTTEPSPVRSRLNKAAAMPPAIIPPLSESPNCGPGWPTTSDAPSRVAPMAGPPRAQNDAPSYPPFSASGPRGPWPLPRA